MKLEFILVIKSTDDVKAFLGEDKLTEYYKRCEAYIGLLQFEGKLIASQPLLREGIRLTKTNDQWVTLPLDPALESAITYYHIFAQDMDEAIAIAKRSPEFEYIPAAVMEIRPVKMNEDRPDSRLS